MAVEAGSALLPLTISDARPADPCGRDTAQSHHHNAASDPDALPAESYVCSPYTAYVSYSREELPKVGNIALERVLGALIGAVGLALDRCRIDDVVFVNNWLLSTNLYPRWDCAGLDELTALCAARWPGHAVAFRSLNSWTNAPLIERLLCAGYFLVPSRQVYLFDGREGAFARRSNTRADLKLLDRDDCEIVEHDNLNATHCDRFEALYRMLYLEKYTPLNPQYTAEFMRAGLETRWLHFTALRGPGGELDGVLGTFEVDGVLTAPIVGYDTRKPRALALYRRLMALVLREALDRSLLLNLSSGASGFKRLRGGQAAVEYTAVYTRHLPPARQAAWRGLAAVVNRIGLPILTRYEL
ncbi:MAG: hypothetical protein ACR2RL_06445 [Gammaproteobacteria bacterium]